MSITLERLMHEVAELPKSEQYQFYADLRSRLEPESDGAEDELDADWDAELESRVNDITEGKVELISAAESNRRLDAIFAKHGVQRQTA